MPLQHLSAPQSPLVLPVLGERGGGPWGCFSLSVVGGLSSLGQEWGVSCITSVFGGSSCIPPPLKKKVQTVAEKRFPTRCVPGRL